MHTLKALLKSWWIQAAMISYSTIWAELVCATCMLPDWNHKEDGGFPTQIPDLVFVTLYTISISTVKSDVHIGFFNSRTG